MSRVLLTESYDPTWLVELAEKEYPEDKWLHDALSKCTRRLLVSDDPSMVYFVSPENANMRGSDWQFSENVVLETYKAGEIVLDIMKDGRVGSIEQLWLIP
jgi:hypothetical protein